MRQTAKRALVWIGWVLLGLASLVGIALSLGFLAISTPIGRDILIPRLVRAANEALAGRIELDSFHLLPQGGVELVGLRVIDPDGDLVLSLDRARVFPDLSRLRSRSIGARIELDRPVALLKEEEDGSLSLTRAFAPTHPSPPSRGPPTGESPWTVRLTRLTLQRGDIRYVGHSGDVRVEARDVSIEARGQNGPRGSSVELKVRGDLAKPVEQAAAIDLAASLRESRLAVRLLRVALGPTTLEAVAEADLRRRSGRAAVLSMAISADEARALVPRSPLAGDLSGALYAESDGSLATVALAVRPSGASAGRASGGKADAAAAMRLARPIGAGFDLALDRLDPSRLFSAAPPGEITLTLRGRAAGTGIEDLRGALALSLAPSRVRRGVLGPAKLRASAQAGSIDVSQLELTLPGASLHGAGRYRLRAMPSGQLTAEMRDLAALRRGFAAMLGRPLPPMRGSSRLEVQLGGDAGPSTIVLSAPTLALGATTADGVSFRADVKGPVRSPGGTFEARAARVTSGELVASAVALQGQLERRTGQVALSAALPRVHGEVSFRAAGALSDDGKRLTLSDLLLGYPGARFGLVAPATVSLAGPSVDRLELVSDDQRLAISGGVARKKIVAHAEVSRLDLARLPPGLFPRELALGGRVSLSADAEGPVSRPKVSARMQWSDGRALTLEGLNAAAEAHYEGKERRARIDATVRRAAGGEADVRGDIPVDLAAARARAPLSLRVRLRAFPLAEALRLARSDLRVEGTAQLDLAAGGTVGAPTLSGDLELADLRYEDLEPATVRVTLEDPGERARLTVAADYGGARAAELDAEVPLDLGDLVRDPGGTARGIRTAPLGAVVRVPGLDLAALSGRAGIPPGLAGILHADAELRGSLASPRGKAALEVARLAYGKYSGVGARVDINATDGAVEIRGRGTVNELEVLRLAGSIALPAERLARRNELDRAAVALDLEVPRSDLTRIPSGDWTLGGTVEAAVRVEGSLGAPRADVRLTGQGLTVRGQPIGTLSGSMRYRGQRGEARLDLTAAGGGTLHAELALRADLGREALARGALAEAPAQARVVADRLDLGFLPAVAPALIRTAQGHAGIDLIASGPLARMRPQGTLDVAATKVAIAELGDWTDIVIQASLSQDVFRMDRFSAHRGGGQVTARVEARGLARKNEPAQLQGEVRASGLTVSRAGQDLATIDLNLNAKGKLAERDLQADVTIPNAVVRFPGKTPRALQSLETRPDIVVETGRKPKVARAAPSGPPEAPPHAVIHLLVPNRFFLKSDSPRMDIELKADLNLEYLRGELLARGQVDTIRGQAEPIGGRNFTIERGRVQFTGGPLDAAVLDINAVYENPTAKVDVLVSGPATHPQIKMSSVPPMEESQIAMLIATGHAESKAGSGGVASSLTAQQVGTAALGAVATKVFQDVVAGKLPLDVVAFEAGADTTGGRLPFQLRAGKYLSDKIYVGYTRRFNANPERGENINEVRIEFQITPRWTFESRYGDANNGGADLIWSKDY